MAAVGCSPLGKARATVGLWFQPLGFLRELCDVGSGKASLPSSPWMCHLHTPNRKGGGFALWYQIIWRFFHRSMPRKAEQELPTVWLEAPSLPVTQTGSPANGDFWEFSIFIPEKGVSKKRKKWPDYALKNSSNISIYFSIVWQLLTISSFKWPKVIAKKTY